MKRKVSVCGEKASFFLNYPWACFYNVLLSISALLSVKTQSEDVVVHIVAISTSLGEIEYLGEVHGWTPIDGELTHNKCNDSIVQGWLIICSCDLMLDVGQATELLTNALDSHELLALISHHRLVSVETGQAISVSVKCGKVVLHKLLSNSCEICHLPFYMYL